MGVIYPWGTLIITLYPDISIPGNRRRGRPSRAWINDITDWTDMSTNKVLQMVCDREYWRDIVRRAAKVRNDE